MEGTRCFGVNDVVICLIKLKLTTTPSIRKPFYHSIPTTSFQYPVPAMSDYVNEYYQLCESCNNFCCNLFIQEHSLKHVCPSCKLFETLTHIFEFNEGEEARPKVMYSEGGFNGSDHYVVARALLGYQSPEGINIVEIEGIGPRECDTNNIRIIDAKNNRIIDDGKPLYEITANDIKPDIIRSAMDFDYHPIYGDGTEENDDVTFSSEECVDGDELMHIFADGNEGMTSRYLEAMYDTRP